MTTAALRPALGRSAGLGARPAGHATAGPGFGGHTPRPLVLALAAFLAINFARVHEGFWVLAPLHLGQVTGVPLILLALTKLPRDQMRAALRTGPGRGMLFIGLMMILSIPLSIWIGNSVAYVRSNAVISYIMFVTTAAVLVDRGALPVVLRTEVLGVAVGAARMFLPGARLFMEGNTPRYLFGWTYDPNDTAVLFVVTIPIALYLGNQRGRWYVRLVWYAAALLMVMGIVRTGSRGGLIGLGAMLATLVLLAPPRHRVRIIGAGVGAALVFGIGVQRDPILRERFASVLDSSGQDYNYTSVNGRVEIWKRGVYYMVTHPLTGVGIDNFRVAEMGIGAELKRRKGVEDYHMFTAHNSLVQIGAELGFPGLIAYLFVVVSSIWGMVRVRRGAIAARRRTGVDSDDAGLASAVVTALVGVFVGGLFLSLAYSPMTAFVFALSAAVIAGAGTGGPGPVAGVSHASAAVRSPKRRGGLARLAAR